MERLQVYSLVNFKYLAFKEQYYSKIKQSILTLKHILGLIFRNVHCVQVVLQIKFNYNFYVSMFGCEIMWAEQKQMPLINNFIAHSRWKSHQGKRQ